MKIQKLTTTKYQNIKDYVLKQISSTELEENDRIPSENEFIEMFKVSSITVRRAMNELVSEGVIYRIKGKGSYVSEANKSVANRIRGNMIAFVLSSSDKCDVSHMQIIKGIQAYISSRHYSLILEYTDGNLENENRAINRLIDNNIEGILIYPSDPEGSIDLYRKMRNKSIPFVIMDRYVHSFPVNYVANNNHDGAYSATEYLIQLGHSKIAFVSFDFHISSEQERYEGYCDALHYSGINIEKNIIYPETETDIIKLVSQIRKREVTAIVAANDRKALEIMDEFEKHSIKIPEDVSIIGYDDYEPSKYAKVPLSTVKQNFDMLGFESARLLIKNIKDVDNSCKKILLPAKLLIRKSTGPVN